MLVSPLWGCTFARSVSAQTDHRVLATNQPLTMQKEVSEMAGRGFVASGLSVSGTAYGGKEIVVIVERGVAPGSAARFTDPTI